MTTVSKKRVTNSVPFGTRIAPSTAKMVRAFARKNKMPISTITNSALRIFIDEAKKIADTVKGDNMKIDAYTADAQRIKKDVDKRVWFGRHWREERVSPVSKGRSNKKSDSK